MPLKNGRLTAKERVFVKAMAATNDPTYAATKARYSSPSDSGYGKAKALAEYVQAEQMRRIESEVLPLAVDVHLALLRDDKTPAGAKVSAVKLAYDVTIARPSVNAGEREPHEMSIDEIQAKLAALEAEAGGRAKLVEQPAAQIEPPSNSVFD